MKSTMSEFTKKLILFFLGFLGMYVIIIAFQLLNLFGAVFAAFDVNLLVNQINFLVNSNVMINYVVYVTTFIIMIPLLGPQSLRKILLEFKVSDNVKNGIAFGIILMSASAIYNNFIRIIIPNLAENQNEVAVEGIIVANPFLSAIVVAILGPVVEEITYRFGLFGSIRKKSRVLAYIATILVFSLIHFNFACQTTNEWIIELLNLPSYMIAAAILCYAYDRNSTLSVSIIAHILNNGLSVLLTLLMGAVAA